MFTVSSCAPRCCGTADDTAGTDVNVLRRVARASAFFARASVDRMNSCSHTAHGIKAACEHKFIRSTPASRLAGAHSGGANPTAIASAPPRPCCGCEQRGQKLRAEFQQRGECRRPPYLQFSMAPRLLLAVNHGR